MSRGRLTRPCRLHWASARSSGAGHQSTRTTVHDAEPPRLLLTLMLCGFTDQLSWPEYLPPPLFVSVPIVTPVDETMTVSVAEELVLVAWTRRTFVAVLYSQRVTFTVSPGGGGGGGESGFTVKVADLVTP